MAGRTFRIAGRWSARGISVDTTSERLRTEAEACREDSTAWLTVVPVSVAASGQALVREDFGVQRLDLVLVRAERPAQAAHGRVVRLVPAERLARAVRARVVRLVPAAQLVQVERLAQAVHDRAERLVLAEPADRRGQLARAAELVQVRVQRAGAAVDVQLVAAVIRLAAVVAGEVAREQRQDQHSGARPFVRSPKSLYFSRGISIFGPFFSARRSSSSIRRSAADSCCMSSAFTCDSVHSVR